CLYIEAFSDILPSSDNRPTNRLLPYSSRHPGLEPGSTYQPHVPRQDGSRLKAGMTKGVSVCVAANQATAARIIDRIPPHAYFVVSAVFHYLGTSFAVLLFAAIEPLGVAWLRIASAAVVFAPWRRPLRYLRAASKQERWLIVAMAATLAAMNCAFYLAIARLPLATVGAIEFLGPILLAAIGMRTQRNIVALSLAVAGVWYLTDARWMAEPLGYLYAFANCALFMLYVVLGHRLAASGGAGGID